MCETDTQMRRSISMPAKPLQLEQKTLKRSEEKENVFVSDDSMEEEDSTNANYLRQGSSPAMVTDNTEHENMEPTSAMHGLTKHIRSVRDFLANSMNPILSTFRKFTQSTTNASNINGMGEQSEGSSAPKAIDSNGDVSQDLNSTLKDASSDDQKNGQINRGPEKDRVVFSLS